ncbi:MAG: hypothetical protein K6A14_08865 [Erysipelotrichaceae bacterium]|nr:hypothetical protein [Erysipelotrichaceae bacterium]
MTSARKNRVSILTVAGIMILLGALVMGALSFRVDTHDYSSAVDFRSADVKAGQPAYVRIEALEQPFGYDDELEYRLGYHGDDIFLLAVPVEDDGIMQKDHTASNDGLLIIFSEDVRLEGCVREISADLRAILMKEYALNEQQVSQLIGSRYLAAGQPVNEDIVSRYRMIAGASLAVSLICFLAGRKKPEKKENNEHEDGNRTIFLVE